ncbi:MAG TPA: DUF1501 domain-containing protein [Flavobacteriales bacterium]|nr:DUF1501 domain-containing protein [Flavobacteriales bacterium]HRE98203.1 DUF1501 domain-containing protein [Flavobacteriales bacterium]HRJ38005.1 DUF1501 domain-containing protein [Flavobacteriales bacterium]
MAINRRTFIRYSALTSASLMVPEFLRAAGNVFNQESYKGKILVVIQLSGGNDGLNCVVPVRNDIYYKARPGISLKRDETILLNDETGLHPHLRSLADLFNNGELSIVNGVGYPHPNRSHFRSTDIWQSASDEDKVISTGWLGRTLDLVADNHSKPHSAVEIDDTLSMAMRGEEKSGFAFRDPKILKLTHANPTLHHLASSYHMHEDHPTVEFLHKTLADTMQSAEYLYEKATVRPLKTIYPFHEFGKRMKTVAELICAGSETMIYYVSLPGFDTHVMQNGQQGRVLKVYSESMKAFSEDLKSAGRFDDTVILTFSEFGRRVEQNASKGTDHGAANNVFIAGGKLAKSGLYNPLSDLSKLDDGDIIHTVDFRSVYSTILDRFLQVDPTKVIDGQFERLNFL